LLSKFIKGLRDFLKGLFLYNIGQHFYEQKRCLENVFMLVLFGPMIGVPCPIHYYSLRLLPYSIRGFHSWKRRMVKERDFFDQVGE